LTLLVQLLGGILSQGEINKDRPVAYASRTLTDNELKYDTYEKEALAIVYCVKHFRSYLYGRKFILVTDQKPLLWFKRTWLGGVIVSGRVLSK